ncbi:unnamed protein product, partial [Chrysoparadoxa australica]
LRTLPTSTHPLRPSSNYGSPPQLYSRLSWNPSPRPTVALGGSGLPEALISSDWYIWTVLFSSASLGLWGERTSWGSRLSAPICTLLFTLALCNTGFLPFKSPVYDVINKFLVPIAVPLLLFNADLRRVIRYAGSLMMCFVLGSIGTVLGTLVATRLVPLGMGADSWKIAACLAARHIGGAVNYVGVAETLGASADAVFAGLAADNVVVALYFSLLFSITSPPEAQAEAKAETSAEAAAISSQVQLEDQGEGELTKAGVSNSLAAACAILCASNLLSSTWLNGASPIPIASLLTVALATLFPKAVGGLAPSGGQLGIIMMQLFFGATGACGSFAVVMARAPMLLLFSAVQLAVHFGFMVGTGTVV